MENRTVGNLALLVALSSLAAAPLEAQTTTCKFRGAPAALAERPSPLDSVDVRLGDASAKLCYGRPSARGRTMIGGEDPYGSPWRFGANEPTTLHLPFPATIGDVALQPGSYSLYAIPEEQEAWTIVVNGNTNRWGIPINPDVRRSDIGSFEVDPMRTSSYVDLLTFRFEGSGQAGTLVFAWEDTTLRIPIARR
jgi:hypothetical protein